MSIYDSFYMMIRTAGCIILVIIGVFIAALSPFGGGYPDHIDPVIMTCTMNQHNTTEDNTSLSDPLNCSVDIAGFNQTIYDFLKSDTTNAHRYTNYYKCGDFTRDLAKNASNQNIILGGMLLGNNKYLQGQKNHIVNFYIEDNITMIIEPQTDGFYPLNQSMYSYYKMYEDGEQTPSNWKPMIADEIV